MNGNDNDSNNERIFITVPVWLRWNKGRNYIQDISGRRKQPILLIVCAGFIQTGQFNRKSNYETNICGTQEELLTSWHLVNFML